MSDSLVNIVHYLYCNDEIIELCCVLGLRSLFHRASENSDSPVTAVELYVMSLEALCYHGQELVRNVLVYEKALDSVAYRRTLSLGVVCYLHCHIKVC